MTLMDVKPLPGFEHLERQILVAYNGHGAPSACLANPEDLFFVTRSRKFDPRPTAYIWMVPVSECP